MNINSQPIDLHPSFFHHIELQSQEARLLASTLSRVLCMPVVATLRSEHGMSYCLQSQQAVIVCTASLDDACSFATATGDPAFHVGLKKTDGIKVRAIGLNVADTVSTNAYLRGVLSNENGETIGVSTSDMLEVSLPHTLGSIGLRFVAAELHPVAHMPSGVPRGVPGFADSQAQFDTAPSAPGGIVGIDHVAVNVNDVPSVCGRLKQITGWEFFRKFEENALHRPLSAMTIRSRTAEGLLTIVQPTSKASIFEHTLTVNGGTCVHHVALRCENILQFADCLAGRGLWISMPAPPAAYYRDIKSGALDFLSNDEFEKLERYGMLLDYESDCALIQVFLPYLGDAPGVFFELISRIPRRNAALSGPAKPGCGGFGDRNVTQLYDCLIRAVDQ